MQYEKCILFLTNNRNSLVLYNWLKKRYYTCLYSERIKLNQIKDLQPEFIISYNYIYMITEDIISYMRGKIINLHISYLPWNRGCSPNIWSFIENTPKGVTIHEVSSELDKGKILYQKECFFDISKETFISSYQKLHYMIMKLFQEKWEEIMMKKYILKEQQGIGSYHTKKDLQLLQKKINFDWNDNIEEFLIKYRKIKCM